jgi:hypothetical protein
VDGVDCDWLRAAVIESLQMLGAPASTQIEYVRNSGFHHDELALELDAVLDAFLGNCQLSAKGAWH